MAAKDPTPDLPEGVEITHDHTGSTLRITGARPVRALAHAARQHVIELLYDGHVLTASAAATAVGTTPSAMSYHLRALEKFGIVRRADSLDGRERPWRAAADHLAVTHSALRQDDAGTETYLSALLPTLERALRSASGIQVPTRFKRTTLQLTPQEAEQLNTEVEALLDAWAARHATPSDGARTYTQFWIDAPTGPDA